MRRLIFGLSLLASTALAQTSPQLNVAVFFNDFSSDLEAPATDIVKAAADAANLLPNAAVRVTGYADNSGSTEAEIALSKRRADNVAALLVRDGVADARIARVAVGTPPNSQPGVERRRVTIEIDNVER